MRIASWRLGNAEYAVVDTEGVWVRVADLVEGVRTIADLIRGGESALAALRQALQANAPWPSVDPSLATTLPAIPQPANIIAIGRNYEDHASEEAVPAPTRPEMFLKHTSSVSADRAPIAWDPDYAENVDWEAELAVVIGRDARDVDVADALDYVFGYSVLNDVTARDLQFADAQWARGKSLDGFAPVGPWIVTRDEIEDPQRLRVTCFLNDLVVQEATTADMFFSVAEIISFCSRAFTLKAGDLIATGTPGGVGAFRTPPIWLRDGDTVTVRVEDIGTLVNPCVAPRRPREKGNKHGAEA